MVSVTRWDREKTRDWADTWLDSLLGYWEELPDVADEFDSWDVGEAQTYIEEWRHFENQRLELEQVAGKGVLTAEQEAQLQELRQLVEQHKPLLDRLLCR